MIGATLLSEFVTPAAEIKSGEADLTFRGKAGGGRLNSGYWFKEPTPQNGTRIINIKTLLADGQVKDVTLYEFRSDLEMTALWTAPNGRFSRGDLVLTDVSETRIDEHAPSVLADAKQPKERRRGSPRCPNSSWTRRSAPSACWRGCSRPNACRR